MDSPLLLFERYPLLASRVPRIPLTARPTPVHPMETLTRSLGGAEIWVKRDDRTSGIYGGNKPRKLEFLLADAQRKGCRRLVTFGIVGSHHGLATAIFGAPLGLKTLCLMLSGPVHPHALANLLLTQRAGAEIALLSPARPMARALALVVSSIVRERGALPYVIPPGGSSVLGCLGYVEAGLELARQVEAKELDPPDYVCVAAGSLGTMAGLLVGLRLGGLASRVIGVAVVPSSLAHRRAVARKVDRILHYLRNRAGASSLPEIGPEEANVVHGYLGRGYGYETAWGERASSLAARDGLVLDPTYTAKTFAAVADFAGRPFNRGKKILYWHTLSSADLGADLAGLDPGRLPAGFEGLVRGVPWPVSVQPSAVSIQREHGVARIDGTSERAAGSRKCQKTLLADR